MFTMALHIANNRKAATKAFGGETCYPIAFIRGGDDDSQKVYVAPDAHKGTTKIDLPFKLDSHACIEPTNDPDRRDVIWCFGMHRDLAGRRLALTWGLADHQPDFHQCAGNAIS